MKKVRKAVLFFLGFILLQAAQSQTALHIQLASGPVPPAFTTIGDSFTFNVLVRNDSAFTFQGTINFAYSVDTIQASGSSVTSGFQYLVSTDSILPGDSVIKALKAHVTNPVFKIGPSVVVIWPIATNGHALDSLVLNINVLSPSGISAINDERIKAYIINNTLMITSESEIQLKRVRIYDVLGKEILNKQNPLNNILLSEMNTGIYFAEIIYNNNQRRVFRFYH